VYGADSGIRQISRIISYDVVGRLNHKHTAIAPYAADSAAESPYDPPVDPACLSPFQPSVISWVWIQVPFSLD